jgi:cardiolipin synthase
MQQQDAVLDHLMRALRGERSLRSFISVLWRFGRETGREHASLKRSFALTFVFYGGLIAGLDAVLFAFGDAEMAFSAAVSSGVWWGSVALFTFFMLGLMRGEDGAFLARLHLPNQMTLLRLVLVPHVFSLVLFYDGAPLLRVPALALYGLLALTDATDGFIARRCGLRSVFGRAVDPACDWIYNTLATLALTVLGALPWWFFSLVVVRYFLPFVCGYFVFLHKRPFEIHPTAMGKITGFGLGLALGLAMVRAFFPGLLPGWSVDAVLWGCVGLLLANIGYLTVLGLRLVRG